jgi:hypothetical protein
MKARKFLWPIIILVAQASAFADGGGVQLREEAGDFVITVFTSSARLTAGPADINVLLQDRTDSQPVLDADVWLLLREEKSGARIQVRATREQAPDKPHYFAPVTLDAAGKWTVGVTALRRGSRTDAVGVIDVAPTPTMVASYWGYVALTPVMMLTLVLHGWITRGKE